MGRGPSYPYTDLEGAIAYTRKVYEYVKRGSAPVDAVVKDGLKLSTTSSGSQKVIAALRSFGMIEDAPASNGKAVKMSPRAIRILLDDVDSQERQDELKKAALSPKWYEYCWSKWGKDMPPAMRSNLLIEHGFIESTVDGFLNDYRKTIAFAGLLDDVIFSKDGQSKDESNNGIKIGDWVQCDLTGELRLPEPLKLIRIENHPEHGKFGFVEGQKGGIEFKHLIKVEPPPETESKSKLSFFTPPPLSSFAIANTPPSRGEIKMEAKTFSDSNGVAGQLQWPSEMSAESYLDFLHELAGLRMRVRRAVVKEQQARVQSQDEEAAKEESKERMDRSS